LREGKTPPRIGVFYDTSTLQYNAWNYHADLTTDYGKSWFYATVRDFFSAIPPKHWAMINGKPIILMYAAAFAKKWDQGFIEYTKAEFKKEFSREPYIAPQDSWRVKGDNICAWGGAFGLKNPGIGELGPGYDDTAVYGRKPLIQKREGGKFYEQQWLKFLRRPSNFVMIETWNELHEGTEICETKEYGRQYIELTRKYSDLFKRGWQPPAPVGRFSSAQSVSVVLGPINQENGLRQIEHEDGQTTSTKIAGSNARTLKTSSPPSQYIYFVVDESFKSADAMNVTLEIEYHDAGQSTLTVEFDGSDPSTPFNGAYSRSVETVTLSDSKSWKTAPFQLNGARFANSQNSGADFRLATSAKELAVRKVTLKRH
jgi:hypothetical protein